MKQIKTIMERTTLHPIGTINSDRACWDFDDKVNEAIEEGWTLCERKVTADGTLIAELEKEIITEEERCCENCKHYNLLADREPCLSCSETCSMWEEAEG